MTTSVTLSRQSKLQEDTDFRILRLLQDNPRLTQRELAKALGISLGGLNYCLQALLNKGWLKLHNFQSNKNKLEYAYLLTPTGIGQKAALTGRFLKRKMEEYELLKADIGRDAAASATAHTTQTRMDKRSSRYGRRMA